MPQNAHGPITVAVVDDDPLICQAMALIISGSSHGAVSVPFTATDGHAAVEQADLWHPDVVLVDIAMPAMDGIETTRLLRRLTPPAHVLILTSLSTSETAQRAVEAGAEGFVSKTESPENIMAAIVGVCDGVPQFNTASQRQLINDLSSQQPGSRRKQARAMLDSLPQRQRQAVLYAAQGCTNAEIATLMIISERTVKAELSSASNRLNMGRVQMARLVERADLPETSTGGMDLGQ